MLTDNEYRRTATTRAGFLSRAKSSKPRQGWMSHRHPDLLVVSLNVHRLLVTCVMVASKMMDDVQYNNAFYARVREYAMLN
ncbi:hypothetical protein JRO89_XS01G0146800 [Xanthoceras sorbifolium]|uniref:Uncharacterized protein n=1 Tax=Xanthoceras sorbifolium TaxID=99658 RepID=A0ABQ8IJE4_9ROSI|nr:hypothetical protein JRO89_XS01G0146800 [Xanthoceras sorbifolium]